MTLKVLEFTRFSMIYNYGAALVLMERCHCKAGFLPEVQQDCNTLAMGNTPLIHLFKCLNSALKKHFKVKVGVFKSCSFALYLSAIPFPILHYSIIPYTTFSHPTLH